MLSPGGQACPQPLSSSLSGATSVSCRGRRAALCLISRCLTGAEKVLLLTAAQTLHPNSFPSQDAFWDSFTRDPT